MPAIQLPETSGKECSHGATDEVGSHENCIDTVRSAGIQFEDTRLVTELDALHPYINHEVKEFPQLRIYSIRAALNFGSLLAMWSCLAFKMGQAPFFANSDVIGMLGLCGVAGALTASFVGRYVKRVGVRRFNFIGCGLILLSWLLFFVGENTYAGIIAGIIMIDIGMQCIQLSNQTSIFELNPRAPG